MVYINMKSLYKVSPCPHLRLSDYTTVMLTPAYKPLLKRAKPNTKWVRVWPQGVIKALQDYVEFGDWSIFREEASNGHHTDNDKYIVSVTGYINKCI